MASGETAAEPLKYQTLTLKVSIHCEGCKRKVKKVLQGIEGVYKTTIDSQQQKVIVTGNVEANTLIKKLLKSGKHAELWPEKKPAAPNPSSGDNGKKNKNKDSGGGGGGGGCGGAVAAPLKADEPENKNIHPASDKDNSSFGDIAKPDGEAQNKTGNEEKKPAGEEGEKPSAGGGSKKKGKNAQIDAASGGTALQGSLPGSQLPAPAYIMSYSTAQPAASYGGAAYYPSINNQSNCLYSGNLLEARTLYIPAMPSAPLGSDLFSEENDNACSVM